MKKTLSLLVSATALAVCVLPPLASAAQLTETGKAVATGAKITVTNTNATTKTSAGTLACVKISATGEVEKNSGSLVEGAGIGEGAATTCTANGKSALVTDVTLGVFKAVSPSSAENFVNVTFKATIAGTPCHFSSPGVHFTYTSGTDSIKISNGNLAGVPEKICEPGTLNGDFTLETDVSPFTEVILD